MINNTEAEEKQYLNDVRTKLSSALEQIHAHVTQRAKDIKDHKAFLWENKTGMDHAEKISMRQSIDMAVLIGEAMLDRKKRIQKLLPSPYFGRVDFVVHGQQERQLVYIGLHAFYDEERDTSLVHDWRAPISTMFYDYETGPAHYESPDGKVSGEIALKRQYRIRDGQMEFMIESDVSIHDDILQKELSSASDERMKTIVATIQRDQNTIIRNENSRVLIIQGVAGSGKTSIALHRIAFLLYRFKDNISSGDTLIISPNKVFADFISNVLPELGEETIPEKGIEELARELLDRKYHFQTFFEQVTSLLENNDTACRERIRFKAAHAFIKKLDEYVAHVETAYFSSADVKVRSYRVPASFLEERFKSYTDMTVFQRLKKIAGDVEKNLGVYHHYDVTAKERAGIKTSIKKMLKLTTLRQFYKDFYAWLGNPKLFKPVRGSLLEYADVFPLIYLKIRLEGVEPYTHVKHLLVDEMQDYTAVQYAVLSRLFSCKKTILGDANQSVNPFSASSSEDIRKVFTEADCVKLCKSYRSTYEITRFAQRISPNPDLELIERRGEEPEILCLKSEDEEIREIMRAVERSAGTERHSTGIICKTPSQAEQVHRKLKSSGLKVYLLTSRSTAFRPGVIVCSAHMAKGLEFDHVIIPRATEDNYTSPVDKSMLYVACTRAMHKLTVTGSQRISKLLKHGEAS